LLYSRKQLSLFRYLDGVGVMLSFQLLDTPCSSNTPIYKYGSVAL